MADLTEAGSSGTSGAGPIGDRARSEVRDLFRRRRLAPRTIDLYLAALGRADAWCRAEGLRLDEICAVDVDRYADTLPQTRPSLAQARSALRHYFAAIGRVGAPGLDITERVARAPRDLDEGAFALERLRAAAPGSEHVATWAEAGYEPAWLRARLLGRQLDPKTVTVYVLVLRRLQRFCAHVGSSIETVSAAELEAFATTLAPGRSSLQQLRAALLHYCAIIRRPDPPTEILRVPRKPRMVCRALGTAEARRLADVAIDRDDRMGLAVVIGLYTGLRRFEIAKLRWVDFGPDGWLRVVGKGNREATVPVHPVVQHYVDRQRAHSASPFVFAGLNGGSVNATTVWTWVRRVAVDAGLDALGTHVLRHTALAIGNDETGDLRAVQDFARHAQIETTSGYTRATAERLRKVADAIGAFYDHGADADDGEPGPEPEPIVPGLGFAELVAAFYGSHAVEAWIQLAGPLARRGWRVAATLVGEANLWLEWSPFLHARAEVLGPRCAPGFYVTRCSDADPGADYEEWAFASARELVEVAGRFERDLPVREPDAGETGGRYWVLEEV